MGGSAGGHTSTGSIVWNVEYWQHNAAGEELLYRKAHNTITGVGLEAAMQLVINASLDIGSQNSPS